MINLSLKTEYSFKTAYGYVKDLAQLPGDAIGIADLNSTYGHANWEKYCLENKKKPIFGVRVNVALKPTEPRKRPIPFVHILIAKNEQGLQEIYKATNGCYEKYYYIPRIPPIDITNLSDNVIVIAEHYMKETASRVDYIGLSAGSPRIYLNIEKPKVAINNNNFPKAEDRQVYELLAGVRRSGTGYSHLYRSHTYPQHILTEDEWFRIWKDKDAIQATYDIADQCNVEIPKAPEIKYLGNDNIIDKCYEGAKKRGIDLSEQKYKERFEREMGLIKEKGYVDYFLIVSDLISRCKKKMLIGPSRGSSAGSLVCYLMGITEINPLDHDLIFERFIDINRFDLPDIDIDFPPGESDKEKKGKSDEFLVGRDYAIRYLENTYGKDKVAQLANINTYKPRTAIAECAAGMGIPAYETQEVKNAVIDRSGGDARAEMRMEDTFDGTDKGREFVEKYPKMRLASRMEAHANHAGTHAAGILVCNDEISKYAAVNSREGHIMLNKKSAEHIGLLKIDCLGLRTLSILQEACELAGMDRNDLYSLPLDDKKTFQLFNDMRLSGIFQFEGQALAFVTRQMGVHSFNDIAAITALARPGAMNSGGTNRYIKYKTGQEEPVYRGEVHKRITGDTMGIVIYQEQMMSMAKEIGNMSWTDVMQLRRAASKSLGDEFFSKYKDKFIQGAMDYSKLPEEEAEALWNDISTTGSWIFNKSHAVSYGLVSYWTAYMKANYPLEFAVANLNHMKNSDSALRFLRDLVKNEGFEYTPIDPDVSDVNWSVYEGKLLGGMINIKGIGSKKAEDLVRIRNTKGKFPAGAAKLLLNPKTPFDILFPAKHYFGNFYDDPDSVGLSEPPDYIEDIVDEGDYMIVGKVIARDLRDRNDYQSVVKRGGKYVDKNQYYLKLTVEDDTDSILCIISPQDFDDLNGKHLAETSIEGETWYLIKGKMKSDWRMLTVENIFNLQEFVDEKDAETERESFIL